MKAESNGKVIENEMEAGCIWCFIGRFPQITVFSLGVRGIFVFCCLYWVPFLSDGHRKRYVNIMLTVVVSWCR